MRRITVAILVLISALLVSAGGSGVASPSRPTHHVPCATVVAQAWTIKVQQNIGVATYRGNRYQVWPGSSFPCSRARALVPRMVRTGTAERLRATSVDGMPCRVRGEWRFVRSKPGRVIAIRPATARGACGSTGLPRRFAWQPAVRR